MERTGWAKSVWLEKDGKLDWVERGGRKVVSGFRDDLKASL